jgi:hypothetical protein
MEHPALSAFGFSYSSTLPRVIFRRRLPLCKPAIFLVFILVFMGTAKSDAQTLYPTSATSTTSGLLQLQTAPELRTHESYLSTDLINQPPGEYLIQAFDAPVSTFGVIQSGGTMLYMGQPTGDLGAVFPEVKLFLNGPSGTPICTMTGTAALDSTITPTNFVRLSCFANQNVVMTPADRIYFWVGIDLTTTPTVSTQAQITIGTLARGFGWPSLNIVFSPLPNISSISPSSGVTGSQIAISGANFGSTQGSTSSVSFNGIAAIVSSWSDTQIQVQVPPGASSGNISVTVNGLTSNGMPFTVVNPFASGAGLQLSISDTPLQVNLTSPQILDWIHWGRISTNVPDRKDGVSPLISDFTVFNGAQTLNSSGNIAFSWTDGNHPAAVSEATEDIETFSTAGGFQITVPADTTVKTLNLYAEVFFGQGVLHASLSDGSAADINDQSVIDSDIGNKVYSIDFRAASAGQTLTVTFSGTASSSGVGLQAATLTPHLPVVAITSPSMGQSFASPATVSASASAIQLDNPLTDVSITASNGTILDGSASPLAANLGPLTGGHYSVTASATDSATLTNSSLPVEFDVIGQGGSITVQKGDIASPVDLTVSGMADWVLWGPQNTGDFVIQNPGDIVARKSGVQPLISAFKSIGNHRIQQWSFANNILFTDGGQNFSSSGSQLVVAGIKDGYEIAVPADTTARTLQLYVGAASARGKITAFLSDGSSPVVTDTSFDFPDASDVFGFPGTSVYAISYSAASAGQTLTIRYTMDFDYGNGQIDLLAAALGGVSGTPAGPAPQITSLSPTTAPTNTKVTISGSNFGALQGAGGVYFAGMNPQVMNWSDTSIDVVVPSAIPDGNTVQVEVFTANGTSNSVNFTIPAYHIFPSTLVLLVGQSKSVTAKDSQHNVVSGLSWSTSDPTIVSVSTDDPALITGLAPGTATVFAGDVPFQVTVYAGTSLPPGTVLWSANGGPGATSITGVVPAVPSDSGVDVLALDDAGYLSGFTSDGEPMWRQFVGAGVSKIIPDFSSNVFISKIGSFTSTDPSFRVFAGVPQQATLNHLTQTITRVDPINNQVTDLYTFAGQYSSQINLGQEISYTDSPSDRAIPSPAGVLFVQDVPKVSVFDLTTNQPLASIDLEKSSVNISGTCPSFSMNRDPVSGQMIVAGDGNAYVPYFYVTETYQELPAQLCVAGVGEVVTHLMLLRVSPDGSFNKIPLKTFTMDSTFDEATSQIVRSGTFYDGSQTFDSGQKNYLSSPTFSLITNADQGVAVIWSQPVTACAPGSQCPPDPNSSIMNLVSQDTVGPDINVPKNFAPNLQRVDGSYVGTDADNLRTVALDGTTVWSTKINPDANGNGSIVRPLYATADGGQIVTSAPTDSQGNRGDGMLFTMDQNGSMTGQTTDMGAVLSWTGGWYKSGTASSSGITKYSLALVDLALSFWPAFGGNLSDIHHPPTLLMTHIYPDPVGNTGVSADAVRTTTVNAVPQFPASDLPVTHTFLFGENVSSGSFIDAVQKSSQAVAYIGHSYSLQLLVGGDSLQLVPVGLFMGTHGVAHDGSGITAPIRLVIASTPNPPPGLEFLTPENLLNPGQPVYINGIDQQQGPMQPRANVIFLGACGSFTLPYQYWFNISSNTKNHVLIVPTDPDSTGLLHVLGGVARIEWTLIAQDLAKGKTVAQAVAAANQTIHVAGMFEDKTTTPSTPIVVPASFQWITIGDANLKLRPTSK